MQQTQWELTVELHELSSIIGADKINAVGLSPIQDESYTLHAPIVLTPHHEEDVIHIMKWANKHRITVTTQGGGTKDAMGVPHEPQVILSMKKIAGIVEYAPRDLTVTVKAGTTAEQLQRSLAAEGQYVPLDMGHAAASTIGGVFSAGTSGPRRAMYGSPRDFLMAARIVYPDGRLIRIGAKVVKNVAGYDMNKLFIGAMGTLGVITELTLKTRPISFLSGAIIVSGTEVRLRQLQEKLLDSQLEPSICEWLYGSFAQPIGVVQQQPAIIVGFDDVPSSVQYQLSILEQYCKELDINIVNKWEDKEVVQGLYDKLGQLTPNAQEIETSLLVVGMKLLSSLTDVAYVYQSVRKLAEQRGMNICLSGGLFTGVTRVLVEADWSHKDSLLELIQEIQRSLSELSGNAIVECAPLAIRHHAAVWGQSMPTDELMREIKRSIDPHHLLNAGRFIGGI